MVATNYSDLRMKYGRQVGEDWVCEVGPNSTTVTGLTMAQYAEDARSLLGANCPVDWVPGDGSCYQVHTFRARSRHWLAFTNPSFAGLLCLREGGVSVGDYVRSSAPQGGWAGLQPLILGLTGRPHRIPSRLVSPDVEAQERAGQHRTQYVADEDASLGRQVRLLVEARRRG